MITSQKFHKTLFIFRRDLRLHDNLGLIQAAQQSEKIIPCFIFDPRQISTSNAYKSDNAVQFLLESLLDLEQQIKNLGGTLYLFYDDSNDVLETLIAQEKFDAVFCNKDYTPFSTQRDKAIQDACNAHNVHFEQCADVLLNEPETVKTGNKTPYAKFTPFYKHCSTTFSVATPQTLKSIPFYTKEIHHQQNHELYRKFIQNLNPHIKIHGGTQEALKILHQLSDYKNYTNTHDFPALDSTTHLSAHLKFGTISIRQLYHAIRNALGNNHPLLRQLYWRDFFYHVAYNNPSVFGHAYIKKYNALWWANSTKNFAAWCQGITGFPIVDAGMRELNTTGYMHNRVRMIVASFLTKDLHIDWQWGEKYFAQQLVDYDPAVNNGNWQWAASTGCDAQPYFRIFNPWLQQKKFDPQCEYIQKWIPELKDVSPKIIHTLFKETSPSLKDYPRPIVDHAQESTLAKKLYKKC